MSRLRGYMQAEIMIELNRLRAEMARRDEMEPLVKQMQAALLTIALHAEEKDNSPPPLPSRPTPSNTRK